MRPSLLCLAALLGLASLSSLPSLVVGDSDVARLLVFCGPCTSSSSVLSQPAVVVADLSATASIADTLHRVVGVCGLYLDLDVTQPQYGPKATSLRLRSNSPFGGLGLGGSAALPLFNNSDPAQLLGRKHDMLCVDMSDSSSSSSSSSSSATTTSVVDRKEQLRAPRTPASSLFRTAAASVGGATAAPTVASPSSSASASVAALELGLTIRVIVQCLSTSSASTALVLPVYLGSRLPVLVGDVLAEAKSRCGSATGANPPASRLLLAQTLYTPTATAAAAAAAAAPPGTYTQVHFPLENGQFAQDVLQDDDVLILSVD